MALIKGDATNLAYEWLDTYTPADQIWRVDGIDKNYFNLQMQSPPLFIDQELDFTHSAGLEFIRVLQEQSEGELITSFYQNLPSTTEQILHPEKYIEGEQEIEVNDIQLNTILDGDWREVINEPIGEWFTYQILSSGVDENARISTEQAQLAVAGWGGDRTQIFYNDNTYPFGVSAYWTWDSVVDADEFYSTLTEYANSRYEDSTQIEIEGADCWQTDSQTICIAIESSDVIWLIAPDSTVMDSLLGLHNAGS